ncbi:MAG: hypothetical protein OEV72_04515 [Thermoleophilia bacterium]|nr:hypothetical protein [Thermoleophilia bacterium]MDH5333518.1 hypothetical protein [Thermoleophilia bacterium]
MTYRPSRIIVATVAALTLIVGVGAAVASSGDFEAKREAFMANVAKRLGVTTDALNEAVKGARLDEVAQALADGRITQEQADRAKERIESGEGPGFGPGFGPRGGPGHHGGLGHRGGMGLDAAATYLGLSQDELRTELRSGKSLATIAGEQGKSVDGLKAAMVKEATAKLDEALQAGRITEEQKTAMLERLSEMIDRVVERTPGKRQHGSEPAAFSGALA